MLASNPDNMRFNGTGRGYFAEPAGTSFGDFGEFDKLAYGQKRTTDTVQSTRNASRATIIQAAKETTSTLTFGLREMTEENLKMALSASQVNAANQIAGTIDGTVPTFASDLYIDLGYLNVFSTKLSHGAVTGGPFDVGETVTGGTSAATGKVAYVSAAFVEICTLSGTFAAGETITGGTSNATAVLSGVEKLEDVILTDTTGATRRVQGTDYNLDPDYGYIRKLSGGAIAATDKLSCDYEAVTKNYIWGLSAGSVIKKCVFVSDKDDLGPRQRFTFHKVQIDLNGDFPLIGDGLQILQVTGTVLADTTQPSGQEYYKAEIMV